jgi:hypothetical protein
VFALGGCTALICLLCLKRACELKRLLLTGGGGTGGGRVSVVLSFGLIYFWLELHVHSHAPLVDLKKICLAFGRL